MQQAVKQTTGISSKSTHKLSKKYDNHVDYLTKINGVLRGDRNSIEPKESRYKDERDKQH